MAGLLWDVMSGLLSTGVMKGVVVKCHFRVAVMARVLSDVVAGIESYVILGLLCDCNTCLPGTAVQ
jgi:hypothetical protein